MLSESAIDKGAQEFKDEVLKSYWKTIGDLDYLFSKFPEAEELFNVICKAPEDLARHRFLDKLLVRYPKDAIFSHTLLSAWSTYFNKSKFFESASAVIQLFKYPYGVEEDSQCLLVEEVSTKTSGSGIYPEMFFCFLASPSTSGLRLKEVKESFASSRLVNPFFGTPELEILLQKSPKELKTKHFFCPVTKLWKLLDEIISKGKTFSSIEL